MPEVVVANRRQARALKESLGELLARANHVLNESFGEKLKKHEVSSAEWRVLAALSEQDGMKTTELAELVLFSQSRLTKTIDRMERALLVQRRTTDADRRQILVFLTAHGRRVAAPLMLSARRHDAAVRRTLGAAAVRELRAALVQFVDRLSEQCTKPSRSNDGVDGAAARSPVPAALPRSSRPRAGRPSRAASSIGDGQCS